MSDQSVIFDRVALIGVGLIGSSIAHAARRADCVGAITATARSAETRNLVAELGLVDQVTDTAAEAVKDADCIILCSPVGAFGAIGAEIADHLKPGAIITDVGSVKGAVVEALSPILPEGVHLIPGHPIAGTEYSGPTAGFASLFDKRWCILTPPEGVDGHKLAQLDRFWTALGAEVDVMTPAHHDRVLAITSHIPHLIAYNIVGTADDLEEVTQGEVIKYSAGGFRDFTRIAASDPTMWRDIFLANKDAVLEMLGRFSEDLSNLQRAIRWGDGDALFDHFSRTRSIRQQIIDAGQETADPDFGRHNDDED